VTLQRYFIDDNVWESEATPTTPVFISGQRIYAITTIGGVRHPFGEWHLRDNMGGVWAHPLRILDGWALALEMDGIVTPLDHAVRCDLFGAYITRHFTVGTLTLEWTEFAVDDQPHYYATLLARNDGAAPVNATVLLRAEADLRFCWFGGVAPAEPEMRVLSDGVAWRAADAYAGVTVTLVSASPAAWEISGRMAQARFPLIVQPGEALALQWRLAVQRDDASPPGNVLRAAVDTLSSKIALYRTITSAIRLETPDQDINRCWQVARQNIHMLRADYRPALAPYLLAGLPEYPQLFGCDTTYSVPGVVAGGFASIARSALEELGRYAWRACSRVPHEITTNGRVYHPGNIQETPQFAVACWDYVRWSGDLDFLERMYPICVEGLEHFSATLEGRGYPIGDGVVEVPGMGACKLDVVCYLYQALTTLRDMALTLGRPGDAVRFAGYAGELAARFESDWWIEQEGMYADSLHLDGQPRFDGHWTVLLPVLTGIAAPERAQRVLDRIVREWVNEWGMVHTRGADMRVWTLPTGLLALAVFRHGDADTGIQLLRNIGATARYGTLGTLKELIPQGLCFIQLWSAALFVQGITEGVFGLTPQAQRHELVIEPRLPSGWSGATLHGLRVGDQTLDLHVTPEYAEIRLLKGDTPLLARYRAAADQPWREARITPGGRALLKREE
jgi:glycogen debranching enzyme